MEVALADVHAARSRCPDQVAALQVAKSFCDAEAYYTYEGTYDVNVLVTGREATGIAAIKAPARRKQAKSAEVQA